MIVTTPLNCVRACVRLLFEGSYYFFHRAPCAATNRGVASIRINAVYNEATRDVVIVTLINEVFSVVALDAVSNMHAHILTSG